MAGLRARTDGGHSPPYTSEADSVKQSHRPAQGLPVVPSLVETQYLASLSPEIGTQASTMEPPCPSCQTKPIGGMDPFRVRNKANPRNAEGRA